MEYTQLPFKFIMYNSDRIVRQNLFLSNDYYYFIKKAGDIDRPYPAPNFRLDNYSSLHDKWIIECLKNGEYRSSLRSELVIELLDIVNRLVTTKLKPTKVEFFGNQNIYDYKFYHKELIDIWIEIWDNVKIEIESLETLLLFKKFLDRTCLNERALDVDRDKSNKMWRESFRESQDKKKYWNDNSYEEGGGGQEWSDPF